MESRPSMVLLVVIISSFLLCHDGAGLTSQKTALGRLFKEKYFTKNVPAVTRYADHVNVENVDYTSLIDVHQEGLKESDKINRLPRQPHVEFAQYGGYITIDKSTGKSFFYYFVQAENAPETRPLLLWLNGGPGCSSLAYGAMEELGPFRVHSDGKTLYKNQYAWNYGANVLFLESPAGVGFSYTNTTSDYKTGDHQTAKDNLVFVLNWLERFPEYKDRDFFIAGESYAGHYIPQLGHQIIQHNKKGGKNTINLKGYIMGNAVINDETDVKGMYNYWWTHALISDQVKDAMMKECDFSPNATSQTEACTRAVNIAENTFYDIDVYNIYASQCHDDSLSTNFHNRSLKVFDPCTDNYVYNYLNMPEVQKALHANVTNLPYDWEPCSGVIEYTESQVTTIPHIKEAMASGVRVWMFSGDIDGRVPVTSTKDSMRVMGMTTKDQWYPWYVAQEVAGYVETYKEGFTFVTVRGGGHMVASYQGQRAFAMISHFLSGTPLPGPRRPL
ncbi:hypothetical protein Dimus_034136 [Dionaea muscipula]